jgi:hypothetical protein
MTRQESPFARASEQLGIDVIVASSPQAKGRVERSHGVYQDRLVKELRMAGISTIEDANRYLKEVYLPKIYGKFAKVPAPLQDAHVPLTTPTSHETPCAMKRPVW